MTGKKSKIVSVALIVLMLGAIFGALPGATSGASTIEDGTIVVIVTDNAGPVPIGYEINVYNADDDSMNSYYLETKGYIEIDVPAGYYEIKLPVQKVGTKVYFENSTGAFMVGSGDSVSQSLKVDSASLDYTLNGTVTDSGGAPVAGASVSIIDYSTGYVDSTTTDVNGTYEMNTYNGTFAVWAYKEDIGTSYTLGLAINSDTTQNMTLDTKPYLTGYVTDSDTGKGIQNTIHVVLYDEDSQKIVVKELDHDGPFFQVSLYPGNFSVLISADGYNAYFNNNVTCTGGTIDLGNIALTQAQKTEDRTEYSFGNDFNTLDAVRTISYSPSDVMEGLAVPESGNLRFQIDNQFGNSDGNVNATEATAFENWVKSMFAPVSTAYELNVNDTYFNESSTAITVTDAAGSVTSSTPVNIEISSSFTSVENIWDESVNVDLFASYDSSLINHSYSLSVPSGYERVGLDAPSNVMVSGFVNIDVDPEEGTGVASISFNIEKSLPGNASINVATGEYVYAREDVNDTYIVKTGKNVSFTAIFDDPNGNEAGATYTWNFGDGSVEENGIDITHAYSIGREYTATLTVTEVSGDTVTAEVHIQADDTAPIPVPEANNTHVDEKQIVEFNASASTDTIDGSTAGIVLKYKWDFGDGNSSVQEVADHSYEKWGTYTVTLNVTDAVGNYNTATVSITVNDITPPVPVFNWTDSENVTHSSKDVGTASVTKGDTISFDAAPSYDPAGYDGVHHSITYNWYFEDTDTFYNDTQTVPHTFTEAGTYVVKLSVTDSAGNHKEITKLFEVKYGPVPRLEIKNLTLSTSEPRAGEPVYIMANISNFGDADALSPTVLFYINDKPLSGTPKFYVYQDGGLVDADSTIPKGEYRIVKMEWTPEQGTFTVKVNATDSAEPSFAPITHEKEIKVTVGQAKWMDYLPIILAVVAIAGVIAVYVMYSKGIGPFSSEPKSAKEKGDKKNKKEKK